MTEPIRTELEVVENRRLVLEEKLRMMTENAQSLSKAVRQLEALVSRQRAMLAQVEWARRERTCPICHAMAEYGHAPADCALAALLTEGQS